VETPSRTQLSRDASTERAAYERAERGRRLIADFECSRCHVSDQWQAPATERSCIGCHQQILSGTFQAPQDTLARWQKDIEHLVAVPALTNTARRFRNEWLVSFLREPHEVRPGLEESMPRLALTEAQAGDIAELLAPHRGAGELPRRGDREHGKELFGQYACGTCHSFEVPATPAPNDDAPTAAWRKAPHLRHVRARVRRDSIVPWLVNPASLLPDTQMPNFGLTEQQAVDIAAYLVEQPLDDVSASEAAEKATKHTASALPRVVTFADVNRRVFRRNCWHCHSDPDFAHGDGGPGNTGGFGFAGVGLNLASYEGVSSGAFEGGWSKERLLAVGGPSNDPRERESIVDPGPHGARLVQALRARKAEERGRPVPGIRGMPLGLPALSDEDIQLVEAWVAQDAAN
jgi:mono/diheme cytochrome c family protein